MTGEVCTLTANSEEECIARLNSRFGPKGYSVLNKAKVRTGFFIKREHVEIQYTVEPRYVAKSLQDDFHEQKSQLLARAKFDQVLFKEIQKIREDIGGMKQSSVAQNAAQNVEYESVSKVKEILRENEFSAEYVEKICQKIKSELPVAALEDATAVQQKVVEWIGESIKIDRFEFCRGKKQAVALVGTTGVGKSTTTIKLTGVFSMVKKFDPRLKISVISTDFVKPGAHEQLDKFCHWLTGVGVEFFKITSYEDLPESLNYHRYVSDLTFVDTRGFAPKDFSELARLQQSLMPQNLPLDIFLTVAASTQASAIETAIKSFEMFNYRSVIVTKLDEAERIGSLLSAIDKSGKKIAYVSDTQEVPNIFEGNPIIFLRRLVGFDVDWQAIEDKFCAKAAEGQEAK